MRALAVVKILNRPAPEFRIAIIVVPHDEKIIPAFKRIYTARVKREALTRQISRNSGLMRRSSTQRCQ